MQILESGTEAFSARWRGILARGLFGGAGPGRPAGGPALPIESVRRILADVESEGDAAIVQHTLAFDGVDLAGSSFAVPAEELAAAARRLPEDFKGAFERARTNLIAYQRHLMPSAEKRFVAGGKSIQVLQRPFGRVGVYVPGGRAPYSSTVLHAVIPARVAGVREICVFTPPGRDGRVDSVILGVCHLLGIGEVYRVGGVQAIGAMAFGTESIRRVDKIVGPGNLYVTLAKKEVYGRVDIDLLAGPSEVAILADETANPAYVAADLLAQAEHDPASSAVLLSTSRSVCEAVIREIEAGLAALDRTLPAARASIEEFGLIGLVGCLEDAIALAEELAPEHLEILTADPHAVLPRLSNAGAFFLGASSPEVAGDYVAGPSHVLPTGGTARFASGLSVLSFLRTRAAIEYDREMLEIESKAILAFARAEGLSAHARSIEVRLGGGKGGTKSRPIDE